METIHKYKDPEIEITYSGKALEELPEYAEITKEVAECEAIVEGIIDQFVEIDASIKEMRKRFSNTANSLFDSAGGFLETSGKTKNSDEAALGVGIGLALGAAGLITDGIGFVAGKVKERQAKKQRDQALEAALEKKKEIAEEKYEEIRKFRNKFTSLVGKKVALSYQNEFDKDISASDSLFDLKMMIFRRNLGLQLKTEFLKDKLDYVLAEMTAWKNGRHDSDYHPKDMIEILEAELNTWPRRITGDKSWDKYVMNSLQSDTTEVPMATALLFTDPTLLSNYVGINFDVVDNCPSALLWTDGNKLDVSMLTPAPFLEKNAYLTTCRKIAEKEFNPPSYPEPFGVADKIVIAIPIIISFFVVLLGFVAYPGVLSRILIVLLGVAISGIACVMLSDKASDAIWKALDISIHVKLPYEKKYDSYEKKYEEMLSTMSYRELNARVDDFGNFEIK